MIENVETNLRPEVNSPSRILSESPDGKLRGIEPFRAICRWKAPMDDMTTIFTSWSLTNSCSHSLKEENSTHSINLKRFNTSIICNAIIDEDAYMARKLIQERRKTARNRLLPQAAPPFAVYCKQLGAAKKPRLAKEGSNI